MAQELKEYISVSDYAKYINKTKQTVYNMIESGTIAAFKFCRGKMSGWVVAKPGGYDEWLSQQTESTNK